MDMDFIAWRIVLVALILSSIFPENDGLERVLEEMKSRKMFRKLMRSETGRGNVREEEHVEYADIGTKCDGRLYRQISWVHYYGSDPELDEEILAEKRRQSAANASQFAALCHNPSKILECQGGVCSCASGTRWRLEQALTFEDGDCRVGNDGDCDDVSWAMCLKDLHCVRIGVDEERMPVKRCRLTPVGTAASSVNDAASVNVGFIPSRPLNPLDLINFIFMLNLLWIYADN